MLTALKTPHFTRLNAVSAVFVPMAGNYKTLAKLEKSSLDFYASIRSLYRHRRAPEINP